jgi:uncharacterized membrane protein
VQLEQDREASWRAHADMEFLAREVASLRMAIGDVVTRDFLRSELRAMLTDLDQRAAADSEQPPGWRDDQVSGSRRRPPRR